MDIRLPNLGEGADSGTVVNVLVKEGDQVAKDQPLLELENEKAVATIPSTTAGVITKIHVKSGDKISTGQRIATITDAGAATTPAAVGSGKKEDSRPRPTQPAVQTKEAVDQAPRRKPSPKRREAQMAAWPRRLQSASWQTTSASI